MILQKNSASNQAFVMTMAEHTAFAGLLAKHFGNDDFDVIEPREEMLYLVANHDAGWAQLDAQVLRNPDTGLPYHLTETPFDRIVETSSASPDFNERHHPYCGLLSSMHSWGLYNGRYGLSDKHLIDSLPEDKRRLADAMLKAEIERQSKLKACLSKEAETASWIEEAALLRNYKLLQFFDTLSLYFNCSDSGLRAPDVFDHVPAREGLDVAVHITPLDAGQYRLAPYPFDSPELDLCFSGRNIEASASDEAMQRDIAAAPRAEQCVTLVA